MKERIIYYINVGQLPPHVVDVYIDRFKKQLNKYSLLHKDLEEYFIPVRNEETRIEVFTEDEKGEWIECNSHVIEVQTEEIKKLESSMRESVKKSERIYCILAVIASLICGYLTCELINILLSKS